MLSARALLCAVQRLRRPWPVQVCSFATDGRSRNPRSGRKRGGPADSAKPKPVGGALSSGDDPPPPAAALDAEGGADARRAPAGARALSNKQREASYRQSISRLVGVPAPLGGRRAAVHRPAPEQLCAHVNVATLQSWPP